MNRSYNAFRLQFLQRRFHNVDPLNGLRIRCSTDAARGVLRRERNPSAHQAASQGGALAAFNKASAYVAALGIALLSGCVALQFSSVVAWRTWVDAVSTLAYVAAGLPFIYVGLLEAGFGRHAHDARREACGLLRRALRPCARMVTLRP